MDETVNQLFSLQGRTALITGAASGIGLATARLFVNAGARVVAVDQNWERLGDVFSLGAYSNVVAEHADISVEQEVQGLFRRVADNVGAIDVLVNNAGIDSVATTEEMSLAMWDEMMSTCLTGVFLCTRAVLPGMKSRRQGRIINIGSQLATKGFVGLAHYCAAKAGVEGFTHALAREVAPWGINANVVSPGPTDTPILDALSNEVLQKEIDEVPLRRLARPIEIAATVLMLAADAGSYYTGAVVNVSGGDVMR